MPLFWGLCVKKIIMFRIFKKSEKSSSRLGQLKTKHGNIQTPFFMPIATKGAVKNLTSMELENLGSQIILSNTYHLFLRPGISVLKKADGLHKLMNWQKPILTDSGGFQVFSLASLRKITKKGVEFNAHIGGEKIFLTPKKVLQIQEAIGSDIRMVLDVCPSSKAKISVIQEAVDLTSLWAKEARKIYEKSTKDYLLFAIVQGGLNKELRLQSACELVDLDFPGYAIGGLAVGESEHEMCSALKYTIPELPENKPRYLMGVGKPEQIIKAVQMGIDMFDCVIPTREARHGRLYQFKKNKKITDKNFYQTINVKTEKFKNKFQAINSDSKIPELREYTLGYLRHLFSVNESLALRLATLNNVEFYLELMVKIREAVKNGNL